MNQKQKICLWFGVAVIVAIGLYPPWLYEKPVAAAASLRSNAGYSWLWDPPFFATRLTEPFNRVVANVALTRLAVQWAIVCVITGGLLVTLRDKKNP